ncbi:MAG: hypothetical protein ABJE95_11630 [Byssovorax sp.]
MRRLALTALLLASTAVGACSLINAPGDVIPGGGGGGGMSSTSSASSSSATASSAESSSAVSSSSGPMCTDAVGCKQLNDACNDGVCTAGMCMKMPKSDGTMCDDGLFCTSADVCTAGVCAGVAKVCPERVGTTSAGVGGAGSSGAGGASSGSGSGAGGGAAALDACHVWSCNEGLKVCEIIPGTSGTVCDDGEPCTTGETCAPDGTCGNGLPTDCSPLNSECALGTCTPGVGCELVPQLEGFSCDGTNFCATSKCVAGKCKFSAPKNTGVACDDTLFCTVGETCQPNGGCANGAPTCVTANKCQNAVCDEIGKACNFPAVPMGQPCEDGDACTGGETCNVSAQCVGGIKPPKNFFFDDFSTSSLGWVLGPEWQIGAAKASPPSVVGADPAVDHSTTADNGVAGIVIGGNEQPIVHAPYYIQSPSIDVSGPGKVFLSYYRWLNSDYLPFMRNMVEVFDGVAWQEVWSSGVQPSIQDSPPVGQGWTFMSHDITAYKSMNLRVRFGYEILQNGAYSIGSWNLDDVKIQNTACPTVP